MAAPPAFPKRPKFFANRFVRVLAKACAANVIGAEACWLVTVIALTEDAKGYREPVTFFNEQLLPLVGLKNVKALDRVRQKAVEFGWLVYLPGGKGRAGRYWVEIPDLNRNWDDAPTDERNDDADYSTAKSTQEPGENRERTGREVGNQPGENRERSGQHSSLAQDNLFLVQDIPPAGAGVVDSAPAKKPRKPNPELCPLFLRFYEAYPHKVDRPAAVKAWAKLNATEELLAAILAGLERYKASKPDWQAWKHPGPWLNARKWEDQPATAAPTTLPFSKPTGKLTAQDVIAAHRAKREQQEQQKPTEGVA